MELASTALRVLTLAVDVVLLTAIVAGVVYAFRRRRKHDE
jgi:cbb3-type cytochrome oxidase subunit 3